MSVNLQLSIIPARIPPKQWESVFQESLLLLDEFPFADLVEWSGGQVACRSTCRKDLMGESAGWKTEGDLVTGQLAESFSLAEDLGYYETGRPDQGEEILLQALPERDGTVAPGTCMVWNGKTQGRDYHLYLLAIACLICTRFPEAAMVDGDISAGQCRKAVQWANEYLDEPIGVPVQADKDRLYDRLTRAGLQGADLIRAMLSLTLEGKHAELGEFLEERCGLEAVEAYYWPEFELHPSDDGKGADGDRRAIREYLELGFDFDLLCRMLLIGQGDCHMTAEQFLSLLVSMNYTVLEKDTEDPTASPREQGDSETVDGAATQFLKLAGRMGGARNPNVCAYRPVEQVKDSMQRVLGDEFDFDALYRRIRRRKRDHRADDLQKMMFQAPITEDCSWILYDIRTPPELMRYRRGCTMDPLLEKNLHELVHQLWDCGISVLPMFHPAQAENRMMSMMYQCRFPIPERVVRRIWAHIMDDEFLLRYLSLMIVEGTEDGVNEMLKALLWNPPLLDDFWAVEQSRREAEAKR